MQSYLDIATRQHGDCQVPTVIKALRVLGKQGFHGTQRIDSCPQSHRSFVEQVVGRVRDLDEVIQSVEVHAVTSVCTGCNPVQRDTVAVGAVVGGYDVDCRQSRGFIQRPAAYNIADGGFRD